MRCVLHAVLPLALLAFASPLRAQAMPSHIEVIARALQDADLLPKDLSPYESFGPAWSRAELLRQVSMWVAPAGNTPDRPTGFVFYTGVEPLDTLRTFLTDLQASGAISARTERRIRQKLEAEEPRTRLRLGVAQTAARLTEAEDRFQPEPLAPSLDALTVTGALTPEARNDLDARLDRGEIDSAALFAAALPLGVLVPDSEPGETPEAFVRRTASAVLDRLRQRQIADLLLGDIEAQIVTSPRPYGSGARRDLRVRAKIAGRAYGTQDFLDFLREGEPEAPTVQAQQVVPLLNKALRDADALHRVYAVRMDTYARQWAETPGTALLALTAAQAEAVSVQPLTLFPEYAVLRNDTLSTSRTDAMLGLLRESGLLNGVLKERFAVLDLTYAASPEDVLETLGLLLFIDAEMSNLDTPYTSLVKNMAELSHGLFAPEAVQGVFDWKAQAANLTFTLGSTRYAADLGFNGDWMDGDALVLVDRAVREASGAKLYTVVYARFDDGRPMAGEQFLILNGVQRELVESEGWLEILPYTEWATAPAFPHED